jgi:hypothetical protein
MNFPRKNLNSVEGRPISLMTSEQIVVGFSFLKSKSAEADVCACSNVLVRLNVYVYISTSNGNRPPEVVCHENILSDSGAFESICHLR